jgi:hypothetical protein
MPKYLKLEKGLNERYAKEMSHTFGEIKNNTTGFTLARLNPNNKIS